MSDVVYEIFPAIGIARVGNAPESFYICPEHAGGLPILPDEPARPFSASDFRDSEGRLRRQGARFRIGGRAPGAEFEEITLDTKDVREIRWTVHLANKKASWYRFLTSKGQHGYGPNHPLRNAELQSPDDRRRLIIDSGPRRISGALYSIGRIPRRDNSSRLSGWQFPAGDAQTQCHRNTWC